MVSLFCEQDPELMTAFSDPEVMAALQDGMTLLEATVNVVILVLF